MFDHVPTPECPTLDTYFTIQQHSLPTVVSLLSFRPRRIEHKVSRLSEIPMAIPTLDIAGVVGTWVAAGLAVIALFGVVGPILVLRASRTERHKAIIGIGPRNRG